MKAKQKAFLRAYTAVGSITEAAKACKMSRSSHYEWMEHEPEYAEAFTAAQEEAVETLEAECWRRAKDGVHEPVIYQGRLQFLPKFDRKTKTVKIDPTTKRPIISDVPLTVRKKSDVLLIFLLKALRPDKYRDNFKGEITTISRAGKIDLSVLTDDEFEQLRALTEKAANAGSAGSGSPTPEPIEVPAALPK